MDEMEVVPTDCKVEEIRAKNRLQTAERRKETTYQILTIKRKLTNSDLDSATGETTLEMVAELSKALKKKKKVNTLQVLSNAFTKGEEYISSFLSTDGALFALIGCLNSRNEKLQAEAVSCLINLSLGRHKSTYTCVKASSAYLLAYLGSGNSQLQELCMWALGNFAADCFHCSEILRLQGFVPIAIKLLNCPNPKVQFSSYFALSCYTYIRRNGIDEEILQPGACELILLPLTVPEKYPEITAEAASIVFNLTSSGKYDEFLHRVGGIEKVIFSLSHSVHVKPDDIQVITPLVRSVGNLCSTDPSVIGHCLTFPSFPPTIQLLFNSRYNHIVKETLWVLSNIISCVEGLQILHGNDMILHRVVHLSESIGADVSIQALVCLCNLAVVSQVHCHSLAIEFNIFPKLKQLLLRLDEETLRGSLTLATILMEKYNLLVIETVSSACKDFLNHVSVNLLTFPTNIQSMAVETLSKFQCLLEHT